MEETFSGEDVRALLGELTLAEWDDIGDILLNKDMRRLTRDGVSRGSATMS